MSSPSNKIDTARQGSPESFDSLDLRGENILVDPSVVGFDRLAVLRPQKPRLPSDDPDQPTAYFLPPVLPKKAVAQRESPAGHNGARNKAAVTYVTTKAKDGSPMEDQYSLTHTDSMDRVDLGEAKDRQLSAQSELLQLHLKAVAKPQLQLSRPLFHSTTTDMGSEDGGIHLEASEAFRRILESLLQQHVRELNDLASIGAAGTRSRGTEPKLKSNPTSPNSVFSRVTKEMDKCVSDNVDSILASTGLRLFQARNILDVLDGDQQELFEKPKGQRVSRMSSDFLPELFEDSEEQRNSYKALPWCHRARIWFQSAGYEMVIALVLCVNVLWMAFELQLYGAQTGGTLAIQEAPSLDHDWWAEFFTIGDITFAGFFAIDVMLRIILLRADFWRVWLNYIDFAVSLTSIAEVAFVYVNQNLPVSPILFRLLRIGKLVRAFRMVTMSSVLNSLQLLIKCLVASRDMLLWSFCLLTFVQCVAGLVLATLCRDFIEEESNDPEVRGEVFRYYGTFTRTILSMFEIMFANWGPPCRVLVENVSEWFSIFFLSYRCVLGFAVLNVVNAVFVQQTMKTASSDEELAFRQKEKDIALYNRKVKKLFKTIDSSGDGAINLEEFSKLVKSPKLQFWMSQLELEYHDLLSLFEFLDNGDGQITLGEFLEGAQRLRGGAKAIDVWRMETKVEVLFDAVLSMLKETCPASAAAILASKGLSPPEPIPPSDSHDNSEELGGTKTEDIITRTSTSNVHDVFKQSEFRHIKPTSFWQLDVNLP